MALQTPVITVPQTDTFDQWRVKTNQVIGQSNQTVLDVGDLALLNQGSTTNIVAALNEHESDLNAIRTITISGDVAGSANITCLSNISVELTIQENSVALGTDTTGDYVATATAGGGISISGSGSENAAITITNTDKGSSQNIFKTVEVVATDPAPDESDWDDTGSVVADTNSDTLTFVEGAGIDLDVYPEGDAIRIINTGVLSVSAGSGISQSTVSGVSTISNTGVLSNVAGTGVSVSSGTGNSTISIGQAVATTSNVQFNSIGAGTTGSGNTGEIRATGNIIAYYSDERLKNKLGNIENALDKVKSLSGFYYEANETAQALGYSVKREVGVSAQEVQAVLPEIIDKAPIDEQYMTVHYDKLTPLLIEAIKELSEQVEQIKKQLS